MKRDSVALPIQSVVSPADAYDAIAEAYDTFYANGSDQAEDVVVNDFLASRNVTKGRVLDLGCGTGLLISMKCMEGKSPAEYVGLDPSVGMLNRARVNFPAHVFVKGIAEDLSNFGDESFDSVVCIYGGFSHCQHPEMAASEMLRVLKPGGRFLIMPAASAHPGSRILVENGIHTKLTRYKAAEARELFYRVGFCAVEVRGFGAYDRLLKQFGPEDVALARRLLELELSVSKDEWLDECRYLMVSGTKP